MPLLRETLKFDTPTDKILSEFFHNNKKLNNFERDLIAQTTYTILRNYYKLTQTLENNIPDIIGMTWIKLLHIPVTKLQNIKLIDVDKLTTTKFTNDQLSTLELPLWMINELQQKYTTSEIKDLALSLKQTAPLDLRINLIKNNINNILADLKEFNPQKMELSPFGIRLYNKIALAKHPLFLNGSIEVQDESSQLAGLLLNPKRGEMVVDFCAGSGGKTLLFGMLMRNSGRIYAFDINERRLNNLAPRLSRSGLSNIHPQLISGETDSRIKRLHNKIDKVFVDAPCSGTGTLRRNPDLKFRQSLEGIKELNKKQLSILSEASKLLKVGGYLVYATCSIMPKENQDIVNQFLINNPSFALIPCTTVLNNPKFINDEGYLALLPNIHNCDGFFAALIQKQS